MAVSTHAKQKRGNVVTMRERSDDGNEVPIGNLKLGVPTVGLEVDVDDDGDGDDAGVCIPFSSP